MERCEIIAEAGINHNGNMDVAKKLITLSRVGGADMVKFQLYDPRKLLNEKDFKAEDWEMVLRSELTFEQTKELKEYSDKMNIEFLASAFDEERLGWLEELGVKRHKIASRSLYDYDYVEKVISKNKETFVSMGYLDLEKEDFNKTLHRLRVSEQKTKLLYCISKYPTPFEDLQINENTFKSGGYFGFSDHTQGTAASTIAMVYGARIIEKHITLDRKASGPDHSCSIVPTELALLTTFRDNLIEINNQIK